MRNLSFLLLSFLMIASCGDEIDESFPINFRVDDIEKSDAHYFILEENGNSLEIQNGVGDIAQFDDVFCEEVSPEYLDFPISEINFISDNEVYLKFPASPGLTEFDTTLNFGWPALEKITLQFGPGATMQFYYSKENRTLEYVYHAYLYSYPGQGNIISEYSALWIEESRYRESPVGLANKVFFDESSQPYDTLAVVFTTLNFKEE